MRGLYDSRITQSLSHGAHVQNKLLAYAKAHFVCAVLGLVHRESLLTSTHKKNMQLYTRADGVRCCCRQWPCASLHGTHVATYTHVPPPHSANTCTVLR